MYMCMYVYIRMGCGSIRGVCLKVSDRPNPHRNEGRRGGSTTVSYDAMKFKGSQRRKRAICFGKEV